MRAGGENGAVLNAEKPDASLLLQVVRYDADIQMPPGGKLPAAEIALIEAWIKEGAAIPDDGTATTAAAFTARARPGLGVDAVIFGMGSALAGIMRASGSVLVPTLISIFCLAFVEVPVAWFMSRRIGLEGVWYAYPAAFLAIFALQAAYYRLVWRHKAIRRLV